MEITQVDVDGVPAFWLPGEDDSLRAGLVFRMGRADQTLPTSGITHLIEHLAMYPLGLGNGQRHDAMVNPVSTSFVVRVSGLFKELCAALHSLPARAGRQVPRPRTTRGRRILLRLLMRPSMTWAFGLAILAIIIGPLIALAERARL
jgi:hypothetical protein